MVLSNTPPLQKWLLAWLYRSLHQYITCDDLSREIDSSNIVATVWGSWFLFQYDFAPVHKATSIKTWLDEFSVFSEPRSQPHFNTCWLQIKPCCPTSAPDFTMLSWGNRYKLSHTPKSCRNPSQKNARCYLWNRIRDLHTLDHTVYIIIKHSRNCLKSCSKMTAALLPLEKVTNPNIMPMRGRHSL